jgi:preprotein translocase subunit SecG
MQSVLIVIHLLIAMALIGVVLLQRSEGGALGIGGGGGGGSGAGFGGLFSPRGAASTLTRTTAILAFLFLVTSMSLTFVSLGARQDNSLFGVPGAVGAPPTLPTGGPPALPAGGGADPAPIEPAPLDLAPAGPPALPGAPPALPGAPPELPQN